MTSQKFKEKENNDWKIKAIINSLPSLRCYRGQHDDKTGKAAHLGALLQRPEWNSHLVISHFSTPFLGDEFNSTATRLQPEICLVENVNSLAFCIFSFVSVTSIDIARALGVFGLGFFPPTKMWLHYMYFILTFSLWSHLQDISNSCVILLRNLISSTIPLLTGIQVVSILET